MNERKDRHPLFAAFVVLSSTAVGAFFGMLALGAYDFIFFESSLALGLVPGAAAGCLAGCLWLLAMRLLMKKGKGWLIVLGGTGLGVVAGFLATVLLHITLSVIAWSTNPAAILRYILFCGVPAGFITGFVCALFAWGIVNERQHDAEEIGAGPLPKDPAK